MPTITLTLTDEELAALEVATLMYRDEGPPDEGWRSPELLEVHRKVMVAIQQQRSPREVRGLQEEAAT